MTKRVAGSVPFKTPVTDQFLLLGPPGSVRVPSFLMPLLLSSHGSYIVSLGNVCRWLGAHGYRKGFD